MDDAEEPKRAGNRLRGVALLTIIVLLVAYGSFRASGLGKRGSMEVHTEQSSAGLASLPAGPGLGKVTEAVAATQTSTPSVATTKPTSAHVPSSSTTLVAGSKTKAPTTTTTVSKGNVSAPPPNRPSPTGFSRDGSFANGGDLVLPFGPSLATAMVVQPDGKTIVGGYVMVDQTHNYVDVEVRRFNPDGTPDTTFGDGGAYRFDPPGPVRGNGAIDRIALQKDGKIVISGSALAGNNTSSGGSGLLRLLADGRVDTTFGQNGLVETGMSMEHGLVIDPDGGIVVAGSGKGPSDLPHFSVWVARYTASGAPDTTFGADGHTVIRVDAPAGENVADLAADAARLDDGAVMVLATRESQSTWDTVMIRLSATGQPDRQFNGNGVKVFDFGGVDGGIAVLPDANGRAIIGVSSDSKPPIISRVLPNGTFDPTFGEGGMVAIGSGGADGHVSLGALARDAQGRIVAAAAATDGSGAGVGELVRYGADGVLDAALTPNPYTSRLNGKANGRIIPTAIAVAADGKIFYSGYFFDWTAPGSRPGYYNTPWFVEKVLQPNH